MISDKSLNKIFQLFMITTYGFGFYYNNLFRIGNLFPSDLILVMLLIALFAKKFAKGDDRIKKKVVIIYFILISMLLMGLFSSASIGNIFRDFKIFIYFFVPYSYLKYIKNNYSFQKSNLILFAVLIITSLFLNWVNFLKTGSVNLENYGIIQRTFGIGLTFSSAVVLSSFIAVYKDRFVKKAGTITYYILQVFFLFSIIVSFTRTLWITYLLVHSLRIIFISWRKIKLTLLKDLLIIFLLVLAFTCILNNLKQSENLYYKAITHRIDEIQIMTPDDNDTLSYRLNDVSSAFYKLYSPRIIFGYGFGDTRATYGYNAMELGNEEFNTESSFFYYIWKYGIIFAFYLFIKVIRKLYVLFNGTTKASKMMSIFLIVHMLIGSMSGNLNNVYSIAIFAFYIGANLELIFSNKKKNIFNKNLNILKIG
ncbi:oligosaccharide repeat unit polymerase [Priestia megaterium]|uniref:O-Antigen ligase family protein n=2 Tax=Priestia megaterium TaxID=1404 RepID=A0A0B6AL98_PRIM2|nr:O-antigen polymerase [Priestia megaterium]AJI21363.1 O-Antigen ligase family protein [Priestia megaterium NBRC 15308 = ATCC 14581]KFM97118.1 O-Antigen ligase family protein [Priestia megaterium]KGJ85380.1 hypothetical protein BMT_28170 [Priestia megaterium NBRC 15308 = ATCC 14581]MDR4233402.1 oligosaccharide repeat unit polymerase [Priestia megaterium]MED3807088.1 O-antigen ligase [Priestia megaterium]